MLHGDTWLYDAVTEFKKKKKKNLSFKTPEEIQVGFPFSYEFLTP